MIVYLLIGLLLLALVVSICFRFGQDLAAACCVAVFVLVAAFTWQMFQTGHL